MNGHNIEKFVKVYGLLNSTDKHWLILLKKVKYALMLNLPEKFF